MRGSLEEAPAGQASRSGSRSTSSWRCQWETSYSSPAGAAPGCADLWSTGRRGPRRTTEAGPSASPRRAPRSGHRGGAAVQRWQRAASDSCSRAAEGEPPLTDDGWSARDHYREGAQRPRATTGPRPAVRWRWRRPTGSMRFDEAALEDPARSDPSSTHWHAGSPPRWSSSPTCPCTSCRPTQPSTPEPRSGRLVAPAPSAIKHHEVLAASRPRCRAFAPWRLPPLRGRSACPGPAPSDPGSGLGTISSPSGHSRHSNGFTSMIRPDTATHSACVTEPACGVAAARGDVGADGGGELQQSCHHAPASRRQLQVVYAGHPLYVGRRREGGMITGQAVVNQGGAVCISPSGQQIITASRDH